MSRSATTVVSLDANAEDAQTRAAAVVAWLLAAGIVVPNPEPGTPRQPSAYLPGPNHHAAIEPGFPDIREHAATGVDVETRFAVHDPGANYAPPHCPACDAAMAAAPHIALVEQWWREQREPAPSCSSCGATTPLADWAAPAPTVAGHLAVRFNDWGVLTDEFLDRLRARIGGRTAVVRAHY